MDPELWTIELSASEKRSPLATESASGRFLVAPRASEDSWERILSPPERLRACALRSPDLRRRFVVARGSLRAILSRYLEMSPADIEFVEEPGTKPKLTGRGADLGFNLSHSKDLAVVIVAWRREVGIDLEWKDPRIEITRLASRFLAPEEQSYLDLSTPEAKIAARDEFFRLWTLREAYLKGLGLGLSVPWHGFALSGPYEDPPRLLRSDFSPPEAWSLQSLSPDANYAGAMAIRNTKT